MASDPQHLSRLHRRYGLGAVALLAFILVMMGWEQRGLSHEAISIVFLLLPVFIYAGVGAASRTMDANEYYVAGRRIPAMYNGMATAADWMSAASFIGLAGTLFLAGFNGLAFVLGWTGGYCLLALCLAPYLRRSGQYTVADFLAERYGGRPMRLVAVVASILCSFVYLVAQIYGVGLITARLVGLPMEIGAFLALGGILVCSFLGGMRAVTWTQVAQYIVLLVAYLVPVVWLSVKQTGVPVPQAIYAEQLRTITQREAELLADPGEAQVLAEFARRAAVQDSKLQDLEAAVAADRREAQDKVLALRAAGAPFSEIQAAEKTLSALHAPVAVVARRYAAERDALLERTQPLAAMPRHAQPFAGDPEGSPAEQQRFTDSQRNFLALVFCLMVGTAGLPHILSRYYTTPDDRQARRSVAWALLFIFLIYIMAPPLAALVKVEVLKHLVGQPFADLPAWVANWSKVDPGLLSLSDINRDGIIQLAELRIGGDIIVLAAPEIGGMPHVITALVAAGGVAAALSTADGLLLTISSALSHDLYYKVFDEKASTGRRVAISKALLLIVALAAAGFASQKPANILFLVAAAFSCAASAFFPALVLGVFWSRATPWGALAGSVTGLAVTVGYMVVHQPALRAWWGLEGPAELWWGIQPISAGVFGVPLGFVVTVLVSWITPKTSLAGRDFIRRIRRPMAPPSGAGPH